MVKDGLFDVSNEIVLVTGVAGQLGCEYARAFLDRGARVVGIDVCPSPVVGLLGVQYLDRFLFSISDVTEKASLQLVLDKVISKFGIPTVLVNNAGIDSPPSAQKLAPTSLTADELQKLKVWYLFVVVVL